MSKLEDLQTNASLRGILPDALVTVVNVQWFGSEALELTYKDPAGKGANQPLYRHDEPRLDVGAEGLPWRFPGGWARFRWGAVGHRGRVARSFGPGLVVSPLVVD